jgi:hypothetical protein
MNFDDIDPEIVFYKHVQRDSFVGVFQMILHPLAAKVYDCKYFKSSSNEWVSFPQKEIGEEDGKKKYVPYFHITDRAQDDRFKARVLEKVRAIATQHKDTDAVRNNKPKTYNASKRNVPVDSSELPF